MANYRYVAGRGPERTKARVGNLMAGLLLGSALLLDLLQFLFSLFHAIPIVGNGIAIIAALYIALFALILFGLWFYMLRVNYFTGKRAALKLIAAFGTFVIEITPVIDALPAITAGVMTMIIASRIEDFVGSEKELAQLSEGEKVAAAASLMRGKRTSPNAPIVKDIGRFQTSVRQATRLTSSVNLERRPASQYGKTSPQSVTRYNNASNVKSAVFRTVRGKNLRAEDRQQEEGALISPKNSNGS